MFWVNFLHFYQPHNQQADILERIVNESYRKLLLGFKKNSKAKATVNINGGLLELLANNGYQDVIDDFRFLAKRNQIEFTGSAIYHPFLPLLPEGEVRRQIKLNEEILRKFLGSLWKRAGFFSPELAYSQKLAQIVKSMGYQWLIAEEIASPQKPDFKKIYQIKGTAGLKILFRDKRMSVLILSAIIRSKKSFLEELGEEIKKNRYLLTVMDAETFGHHRPGLEKSLFEIYQIKRLKIVKASELIPQFSTEEEIEPRSSTWSSEEQDFYLEKEKAHPFTLWQDPRNPIHRLQWEFTYFVIREVNSRKGKPYWPKIRKMLDRALQSDQFWWASARPWWSLEMIEQGAWTLKEVIFSIPNVSSETKNRAEKYYRQILDIAFDWQRRGIIRQAYREALKTTAKIPFKKRAPQDWYNLIILEFEDEMKKAAENLEFEKAIKWRDAIYKLKEGLDIYDVMHVVDDLRQVRFIPSLKSFWEHAPEEFSSFAKAHFENFSEKKFRVLQPKIIFRELKKSYENPPKGFFPIGFYFSRNKKYIWLCEIPSAQIKFYLHGYRNFPCSRLTFPKPGRYFQPGQNIYLYSKGKVKTLITKEGVLGKFIDFLKKKKKKIKIAILPESFNWQPIYFKKQGENYLASFPYSTKKGGVRFRFRLEII